MRARFDTDARYGLRLTLFAVALVLVAVPFGLLTHQVVRSGPLLDLDHGVAERVHGWTLRQPDWVVDLATLVSWLGRPPFLTLLVGAAALYVLKHDRVRLCVFLVTTTLLGGFVNSAVKVLVDRPRPEFETALAHALGKSFPSGHAMGSTISYGALLLAFLPVVPPRRRRLAIAATVVLVLTIAASRVVLGVHFLSDVVGGCVLGLAWLAAAVAAFRLWRADRGGRPAPVSEGVEPEAAADLRAT